MESQPLNPEFRNNPENFHRCTSSWEFYLIETPFNAFANRADSDQAALVRAA